MLGLKLTIQPDGALAERVTVPVNPLSAATVIVEVPELPLFIVEEVGEAEMEKSGVDTGTKLVVIGPPKPVTRS